MKLFLAGDVMTGRGIDQALPVPSDPVLYEPWAKSAVAYLQLAEAAHGPIPIPVSFDYLWGDSIAELARQEPDLRVVNLETSVTVRAVPVRKGINYRMHPANVPCLAAARIDCCALANNHVMDWGRAGLLETVATLESARVGAAGAGEDLDAAQRPAVFARGGRVLCVFAFAAASSGVPPAWAAGPSRPGVWRLAQLSAHTADAVADVIGRRCVPGALVVASVHWGPNWGYGVPRDMRAFAHRLIDTGAVALVHGHSSHHPLGAEVYRDRLVLYGCGDFINDYEGIGGHEDVRPDLALAYFPTLDSDTGELLDLAMVPYRRRRFRLERAGPDDAAWLAATLDREGEPLGTGVYVCGDSTLALRWRSTGKAHLRGQAGTA